MDDAFPDFLFKILLIGDSGVGKSSLVTQFADGTFSPSFISTIGVDFKVVTQRLRDKAVKLQIWDTAGQERFQAITSTYYRGAHAVVVVVDVADPSSLDSVGRVWMPQVRRYVREDVPLFLMANKIDLEGACASEAQVARESAVAAQFGMRHVRVSAKTGRGVGAAFEGVATHLMDTFLGAKCGDDGVGGVGGGIQEDGFKLTGHLRTRGSGVGGAAGRGPGQHRQGWWRAGKCCGGG